jgi:3-oxoacyl-ACP reductase-like protein
MTNSEKGSTAPTGSDTSADPLTAAFSALGEGWMRGAAAMEFLLAQGAGLSAGAGDAGDKQTQIASLIAQSYLVAAKSGVRYLSGVAQVFNTYQASIFSSLLNRASNKQLSEHEHRAAAEDLRAYLREIGDLAHREARLLQVELGQVGEAVAHATQEPDAAASTQRRWKAKP